MAAKWKIGSVHAPGAPGGRLVQPGAAFIEFPMRAHAALLKGHGGCIALQWPVQQAPPVHRWPRGATASFRSKMPGCSINCNQKPIASKPSVRGPAYLHCTCSYPAGAVATGPRARNFHTHLALTGSAPAVRIRVADHASTGGRGRIAAVLYPRRMAAAAPAPRVAGMQVPIASREGGGARNQCQLRPLAVALLHYQLRHARGTLLMSASR